MTLNTVREDIAHSVAQAEALRAASPGRMWSDIARELGVSVRTLQTWRKVTGSPLRTSTQPASIIAHRDPSQEIKVSVAPEGGSTIEEILARKRQRFSRDQAVHEWARLIPVEVVTEGPIGLLMVGDPHVDDDHCDIERLESDLRVVGDTKHFFAGHVGDLTNNWVGRLARLYANQTTTFQEGLKLTEWMFSLCPSLFVIGGNHDCWNNGMDILSWIVRQGSVGTLRAHGARMQLRWPDGSEIRINARHDFPGRSQYSSTHGHKRESLFGHRDHVYVAGHLHVDEVRAEPYPNGDAFWAFRVSGYKVMDDYADEKGFQPMRFAPSVALVLDPRQAHPVDRVKPFWDVGMAADYLTWLRKRSK